MKLFTKLNNALGETIRVVEDFSKIIKKTVGMDVCIDCNVEANDIGTEWFGLKSEEVLSRNALGGLMSELEKWSSSSAIKTNDCKLKKTVAIAFDLVKDKENGRFVKRHLKEIHFVDKIVGSAVNIDNFKIVADEKAHKLEIEQKAFDDVQSTEELKRVCGIIIDYLRKNVGVRAHIKKAFRRNKDDN